MSRSKRFPKLKLPMLIALPVAWFGTVSLIVISLTLTLFLESEKSQNKYRYNLFQAKPLVLGAMDTNTGVEDSRAAKIDKVYHENGCPLEGLGQKIVQEADKNNIPYWIVPAISFQESSCGKKTPEVDGLESYNAWGWAVYGTNVKMFDNWEHGVEVVSKYLSEMFFSQNITEPCEIMKTYTPPSKGSWCNGVEYFKESIDTYKSPINDLF